MSGAGALSTEQIAALFAEKNTGGDGPPPATPTAKARRAQRIRKVDFSRPATLPHDVQREIERAHEAFCRSASVQLSSELRSHVQLSVIDTQQLSWLDSLDRIPQPSLYGIVGTSSDTAIMFAVDVPLVHRSVDTLLGGKGLARSTRSDLSEIEAAVARRFLRSLITPLSAAWDDLLGLSLELLSLESSLASVQLASPSEPTVMLTIELRAHGASGNIAIVIPYRAIDLAVGRLVASRRVIPGGGAGGGGDVHRQRMHWAMSTVDVELQAEVGAVTMAIEDVLALRPGQVIRLDGAAAMGLAVRLGPVELYRARAGRSGGLRAIEIGTPETTEH